ncbi:hypothetical protein M9H77_03255 [Catharanthus roseus]|uniref:Uncharacterized protein n=1 Tax=Catharanthus roseus TaxID=4058 RepID=A0ACC0CAQ5_CATRO|nr:hypothetical protein M9H77_03255 [Catharanthus roseus]
MEELDNVVSTWGFALIGYVAGGFPGIEAVKRLTNTWNVPHKFYVHKSGWLVFRFEIFEDRDQILQGGPYLIYGRPLILKEMPPLFEFGPCTLSVIPIWVTLPGLPLDMWNAKLLGKICSEVGDPICTDAMTSRKERISYARVLVNVDLAKDLTTEVKLNLPNGKKRMQYITYENLPKFCSVCKLVGHNFERCFHNPKNKKELGQKTPMRISSDGKQAGKATAAGDVGETTQMQEGRGTTSNARQRDGQSLIGPKKAEENHRGKRTKAQLPEPVSVSASKGADSGGSKMAELGGDRPTADQIHSETRQEHPDSVSLEDALANITGGPTRSLQLFAVMETKLEVRKLFDIVKWNFAQWKVVHNFEEHEAGRMIVFWNPIMVEVQTMGLHDQVIHLQVTCKISRQVFYVSFVYELHSIAARRPLWDILAAFGGDGGKPWLVLGDFNNILELDDRIGGAQPRAYEALNFQNCCMDLGLTDITYNGA